MKTVKYVLISIFALGASLCAQSLYFQSGTTDSSGNVQLIARGNGLTNTGCVLERLNYTNQNWEVQTTFTITNNSTVASLSSSLHSGVYGFFRARSISNDYKSTNAYGAVLGYVESGYTLVGNPFAQATHTNFFPQPVSGLEVLKWNTATSNYTISDYITTNTWSTNLTIAECEGFFIYNPTTNLVKCLFNGLFNTNGVSKSLSTGLSLITSPRFQLIDSSALQTDLLSNLSPSGAAGLPVTSTGYSYKSKIQQYLPATGTYAEYTLGTNSVWFKNGSASPVSIQLVEGFFSNQPTNTTWQITRTIW